MSQRDGFASGFFAGAIFGSVVGGVIGTLVAQRRDAAELTEEEERSQQIIGKGNSNDHKSAKKRQMRGAASSGVEMEIARRSLEDKIAQLNATIDEVRDQLGNVNNNEGVANELSSRSEELQ
jgi:Na+/glutamate symporter